MVCYLLIRLFSGALYLLDWDWCSRQFIVVLSVSFADLLIEFVVCGGYGVTFRVQPDGFGVIALVVVIGLIVLCVSTRLVDLVTCCRVSGFGCESVLFKLIVGYF